MEALGMVETRGLVAAIEAAENLAKSENKFIVSHVIPQPDSQTDKMAYLLDINRDKFNKKLPKSSLGVEAEVKDPGAAFGLLEVQGLVAAIEVLDAILFCNDIICSLHILVYNHIYLSHSSQNLWWILYFCPTMNFNSSRCFLSPSDIYLPLASWSKRKLYSESRHL